MVFDVRLAWSLVIASIFSASAAPALDPGIAQPLSIDDVGLEAPCRERWEPGGSSRRPGRGGL